MMVARATQIETLLTPLPGTLQQPFCDRISCCGFTGPRRKLEHFRGVEWVCDLHGSSPRLRLSRRSGGHGGGKCDRRRSGPPHQGVPPAGHGDPQEQRDERYGTDEIHPFRTPAYEGVVPGLGRQNPGCPSHCVGGLRKLELLSGRQLQLDRVLARLPSTDCGC